jgi:hypothetical protein
MSLGWFPRMAPIFKPPIAPKTLVLLLGGRDGTFSLLRGLQCLFPFLQHNSIFKARWRILEQTLTIIPIQNTGLGFDQRLDRDFYYLTGYKPLSFMPINGPFVRSIVWGNCQCSTIKTRIT